MIALLRTVPLIAGLGLVVAGPALATQVSSFPTSPAPGQWGQTDVRPGGSASVVDLTGAGGNLENNQPLPTGAAKLTTDSTNAAKAEVGISGNYGAAGDILSSFQASYSYYRHNDAGGNAFTAPSLKLAFNNPSYSGDGYVTLVYEPYWNLGNTQPPSDQWTNVSIDTNSGVFWQTGGFGQLNGAGGPPLHTLADWLTTFDSGFSAADLVYIGMGVGSFNPGQTDYFDDVKVSFTNSSTQAAYSAAYDFDPAATTVPEPGTLALLALGLLGLGFGTRRTLKG